MKNFLKLVRTNLNYRFTSPPFLKLSFSLSVRLLPRMNFMLDFISMRPSGSKQLKSSMTFIRGNRYIERRPVHTRDPLNPRSLPLWKNGRIGNERALIGESVCWSKIQRGLVGPALRGRGERDKFFNRLKMVGDDPALHRSYVERGYSVVVGGTA